MIAIGATIVTYERTLDPRSGRVRKEGSSLLSALTSAPWKTLSADSLRRARQILETGVISTTDGQPTGRR